MILTRADNLSDLFKLYIDARQGLDSIRDRYKNDHDMLLIYEPSAINLVKSIREEIQLCMSDILVDDISADVCIHIEGAELDGKHVPIGVLGSFLQKLSTANKHAVSIIEHIKHEVGRFHKRVSALAEFGLIATAPGSIKIGLQRPELSRFVDVLHENNQLPIFEEYDFNIMAEATLATEKAIEGLQLLIRAIKCVNDRNHLEQLRDEIGQKNTLRVLHYAQDLTPAIRGSFEQVSFYGSGLRLNECDKVTTTIDTRDGLKKCAQELIENQRYIEGHGRIGAIDIDKHQVRARPLYFEDMYIEDIECRLSDDLDEKNLTRKLSGMLNKPVTMSGTVIFSNTGDVKYIEVDEIELDNDES